MEGRLLQPNRSRLRRTVLSVSLTLAALGTGNACSDNRPTDSTSETTAHTQGSTTTTETQASTDDKYGITRDEAEDLVGVETSASLAREATIKDSLGKCIVAHVESGNYSIVIQNPTLTQTDTPQGTEIYAAVIPVKNPSAEDDKPKHAVYPIRAIGDDLEFGELGLIPERISPPVEREVVLERSERVRPASETNNLYANNKYGGIVDLEPVTVEGDRPGHIFLIPDEDSERIEEYCIADNPDNQVIVPPPVV